MKVCEQNRINWEENLINFKHSIFLCPDWIESMCDNQKKSFYINFVQNDVVQAKLSGLIIKGSKWKGNQLYAYAGPALSQPDERLNKECLQALFNYAKKKNIARIVLSSYDQPHNLSFSSPNFFNTSRYEYEIDINTHTPLSYSSRFKKNLRKAKKATTTLSIIDSSKGLKALLKLVEETRSIRTQKKRKNYNPFFLPHMSKQSLEKMMPSSFARYTEISDNNKTLCVGLSLHAFPKTAILMFGMNKMGYTLGISAQLFNNYINGNQQEMTEIINIGGIPSGQDGEHLSVFKESMGAKKRLVHGATTNFIIYPYRLLNPLLNLGRNLPDNPLTKGLKWILNKSN